MLLKENGQVKMSIAGQAHIFEEEKGIRVSRSRRRFKLPEREDVAHETSVYLRSRRRL